MAGYFSLWGIYEILLFFLAVLIHEGGHLSAMLLSGVKPHGFRLGLGGTEIQFDSRYLSYRKESKIHLAGPLAGLAAAFCTILILRITPLPHLFYFFFCNLFLTFLNLLPIRGLDGYHALFCFLCIKKERETAEKILLPYHTAFSLILFVTGLFLLFVEKNPSLILFQILLTKKEKATILS